MKLRRPVWKLICISAVILCLLCVSGCIESGQPAKKTVSQKEFSPVDYSKTENWVLLPEQKSDFPVDVFYVYPTIVAQPHEPYMDWSDPKTQRKAKSVSTQQSGPFASICRIYAPYYRQTEITRALQDIGVKREDRKFMNLGLNDIKDAFRYYLKHYNQGRPFILAGHSQGAYVLLDVIKDDMKDPAVYGKMVAAYLFGFPRLPKTFPDAPHIKLAQRADDTGVIMTWNSEAPGVKNSIFTGPGTYCINPLNWRTDAVKADASLSKGAVFFDGEGKIIQEEKNFCTAEINPETGALIVVPLKKDKYDSRLLGKGVYHMNDIYFFYHDITRNAQDRINAYLKK